MVKKGDLVCSIHDPAWQGVVLHVAINGDEQARNVAVVQWFDGDSTYEFMNMLKVISASR